MDHFHTVPSHDIEIAKAFVKDHTGFSVSKWIVKDAIGIICFDHKHPDAFDTADLEKVINNKLGVSPRVHQKPVYPGDWNEILWSLEDGRAFSLMFNDEWIRFRLTDDKVV